MKTIYMLFDRASAFTVDDIATGSVLAKKARSHIKTVINTVEPKRLELIMWGRRKNYFFN